MKQPAKEACLAAHQVIRKRVSTQVDTPSTAREKKHRPDANTSAPGGLTSLEGDGVPPTSEEERAVLVIDPSPRSQVQDAEETLHQPTTT